MFFGSVTEKLKEMRIHMPIEREETLILRLITVIHLFSSHLLSQCLPEPMETTLHLFQTLSCWFRTEELFIILQLVGAEGSDESIPCLYTHRFNHLFLTPSYHSYKTCCLKTTACHQLIIESIFLILQCIQHILCDRWWGASIEGVDQILHLFKITKNGSAESISKDLYTLQKNTDLQSTDTSILTVSMSLYLSKYLLNCITAPILRAALMYWRVSFNASAASRDEMNLIHKNREKKTHLKTC